MPKKPQPMFCCAGILTAIFVGVCIVGYFLNGQVGGFGLLGAIVGAVAVVALTFNTECLCQYGEKRLQMLRICVIGTCLMLSVAYFNKRAGGNGRNGIDVQIEMLNELEKTYAEELLRQYRATQDKSGFFEDFGDKDVERVFAMMIICNFADDRAIQKDMLVGISGVLKIDLGREFKVPMRVEEKVKLRSMVDHWISVKKSSD